MTRFDIEGLLRPVGAIGAAAVLAAGLSAAPALAQSSTTITTEQPAESQTKTKIEDDGVERTTKSKTENPDGSVTRSKTTEPSGGSSSTTTVEEPPSTTVVVPR